VKSLKKAKNPLIDWRIIGQNKATDSESAKELYHGFVIYYRPAPTKESIEEEISFMDDYLDGKIPMGADLSRKSTSVVCDEIVPGSSGTTLAPPAVVESPMSDTTIYLTTEYSIIGYSTYSGSDYSAVQETFKRHPEWKNSLVVMDVTGSMSPYIAQTMAWVKETQKSSQIDAFVFFNDGDAKPHHQKRVGSVGGVYSATNSSFSNVYGELKSTMRKGGGGDCPENNVEATIKGIDQYPNCDEVIMMADNWATPRDLSLAKSLKKPVHIIVCGASSGMNMQYIQLAYDTGGSIHTIEEDLEMRSIKVGKQFKIGNSYFALVKGRIVRAEHKY